MFDGRPQLAEDASSITIHGAREHNLKNISVAIPRDKFVVITGVSGSGKSTLAFDLLFAEGQRRFLDSMNAYARQFVEQLARPDVDLIAGLPPTVSIEQRNTRGGGKSTVATVTEIFHYLRLLFARMGVQHCPDCDIAVEAQSRDELGRQLDSQANQRGALTLLAPVIRNRKGFHSEIATWAAKHGFEQLRADKTFYSTAETFRLDRFREHDVEIVVGTIGGKSKRSPADASKKFENPQAAIDEALKLGNGVLFAIDKKGVESIHSTERACPNCERAFDELDPKMFSYNSSRGWCPTCRGFGETFYLPEVERGARAEAIEESWFSCQEDEREECPDCSGARINPVARAVKLEIKGLQSKLSKGAPTIDAFSQATVEQAREVFEQLKLTGREAQIARDIAPEIATRLKFLCEVGLGYMQMGRSVTTLSGGESQRIRLAAQLGSNLSGVLYILDEPTIGLHARDNEQLLGALKTLRARGNSLVVVEHDEDTMRHADHIIDLGPGAGVHGGEVVASGTLKQLMQNKLSVTGCCLSEKKSFPARGKRRPVSKRDDEPRLQLTDAKAHNLRKVSIDFPLNRFVVISGVSGSGKSTLIRECLLPLVTEAIERKGKPKKSKVASHAGQIAGFESLASVYEVDQAPIGRTPRSIPATYVGFFDDIRKLFAQIPEARLRGYQAGRFSFNSAQGRCPECEGAGTIKLEMSFLPPAFVNCETCNGSRYDPETLDIELNGKNIAQVLDLSVEEALEFFSPFPRIKRALEALCDTGLDYVKLGQPSPTLSGGEAQRLKLVTHLLTGLKENIAELDPRMKRKLFILEEPTIGLHIADVRRLVDVIQRLVDAGHSVIVIEHNLDLIAEADWVIDLGPEGGEGGGKIVATGTPEQIARRKTSHTGRFLRRTLGGG